MTTLWHRLLDVAVGRGLGPRDQAARILAALLGTAVILMVVAAMANGIRASEGLSDGISQLLIGVLTLLVGTVSGYLARRQDQAEDDTNRAPVGTILTAALGTTMVMITGFSAWDAIFAPDPGVSSNMATLQSAVLGGGIGAASAYLGLPRPDSDQQQGPDRED